MKAIVKFVVLPLAGVVLILAAVAIYVATTFDLNRYKPQIVQAVKDATQRNLRIEGDIRLALFPGIGATLGRVLLSERGSDSEFAGADEIRVTLKLAPLLSKQVVVEAVEVKNLRAHLVRFKDGTTNIDDLTSGGAAAQGGELPVKIDIDHVAIENAAITYTDETAGAAYALSKLNLRTGRIASGVPGKIDLAFTVQSDKPAMNLETVLKATVTFDFDRQSYILAGIDFGAKGLAAGIGDLDVKFDVPRLTVTHDHVSGEGLVLDATLSTVRGKLAAKLEIPGIDGNASAFKAGAVTASIDVQQDGARIKARLTGPLAGSVEGRKLELPKLVATVNVNNPRLLKNPLVATIDASAQVDFARQNASLAFATTFDDSAIKGRAGLAKFTPPFYTFDIDIDQLDADRYLLQPDPRQPLDLSSFKGLKASGSVKIGALKMSNVKATNTRIEIKAADGLQPSPKIFLEGRPR